MRVSVSFSSLQYCLIFWAFFADVSFALLPSASHTIRSYFFIRCNGNNRSNGKEQYVLFEHDSDGCHQNWTVSLLPLGFTETVQFSFEFNIWRRYRSVASDIKYHITDDNTRENNQMKQKKEEEETNESRQSSTA